MIAVAQLGAAGGPATPYCYANPRMGDVVRRTGGGIELVLHRHMGQLPTAAARLEVERAIAALPRADRQLLVREHTRVNLWPRRGFTQIDESTWVIGNACLTIAGDRSRHGPELRVATGARHVGEAVQHEIGHIVSWIRRGDLSEDAATRYAARY